MIRQLLSIVFLLSFMACTQAATPFETWTQAFEDEYATLELEPLRLSYVENLQHIASLEQLQKQERFFQEHREQLSKMDRSAWSREEQLLGDILAYEIELNLERIALEKRWRQAPRPIRGTRLYDEQMGREWYRYFLKKWVDLAAEPDSIYQFGLAEIEQVKAEITAIQNRLEMDDAAFQQYLKSNAFKLEEREAIQSKYEAVQKVINERARRYFPDVDRIPPVRIAPGTNEALAIAPAYYSDNTFYYNFFGDTYDAKTMGWIYMHEAIPGHHYQNHMNRIVDRNSVLDLFSYYSFKEGWGAYVEPFGRELGAFQNPMDRYGQLEWDLIRSTRVALDVGLNYYGWSDEKALDFWLKHLPNKEDIGKREIGRMKRWPAQVVSYKYGKRILDELKGQRRYPEELMAFHKSILQQGEMPLSVLKKHYQEDEKRVAQQEDQYLQKAKTLDQAIQSLYGVISGGKGEARDWDFLRYLFHPEAKLISSGKRKDGSIGARYLTVEEYIRNSGNWMLENGFYEKELHREVHRFGHIAQVFSSYECFHSKTDTEPFMRGINSIQYLYDGQRWQVINIYFTQETPENPIPEAYLPAKE